MIHRFGFIISGRYTQKIDHILLIGGMNMSSLDRFIPEEGSACSKEVVDHFNRVIPK